MVQAKPQEITPADQRVANVEQAMSEGEIRYEKELVWAREKEEEARHSLRIYLKIWLKRHGAPWWRFWRRKPALHISQDELRAAAEESTTLTFNVLEDGETLQISETSEETT